MIFDNLNFTIYENFHYFRILFFFFLEIYSFKLTILELVIFRIKCFMTNIIHLDGDFGLRT